MAMRTGRQFNEKLQTGESAGVYHKPYVSAVDGTAAPKSGMVGDDNDDDDDDDAKHSVMSF